MLKGATQDTKVKDAFFCLGRTWHDQKFL